MSLFGNKKSNSNYLTEVKKPEIKRRQKSLASKEYKKKEKEITEYTQDFIPIKDIRNGIVETTDGRYLKILEVEPINFTLRTEEEKSNIIYSFASWLKISNVKLQFKSITKAADSERHIDLLKKDMVGEKNEKAKELSKAYIRLIRDIGSQEALTRRFFVIMEYEPITGKYSGDYSEIYQTLQMAAQQAKTYLSQCGNNVIVPENEDIFLGEVLYMLLNRRSSLEEPFQTRVSRVVKDTMEVRGLNYGTDEVPYIPAIQYIAPRGIDLSKSSYVIMDGLYYSYMYIKSSGYPTKVTAGWLSSLVNAGEGVDVDVHFKKEDRSKMLDKVKRKVRLNNVKIKDTFDTSSDYEDIRDSIKAGYYIQESISTENQDFIYMTIIVTITSPTLEGLKWKKHQLNDFFKSQDIIVEEPKFNQEEAFLATLPILKVGPTLFRKAKRNVVTMGAASTYLFTAFEMCDDNGILLGVNALNNSLCIIDIFNSKIYKNANMTIIGTSGSGKTFTEQLMALRMRMRGIQVFILAPLKGHEFRRACRNIGGEYIKISSSSNHCINIMEIRPHEVLADELIEGSDNIEEESLLAKKVQQLNTFFSLIMPDMSNEEEQLLDEAIVDIYSMKGITNDNETLYTKDGVLKTMPTLGDLYANLNNNDLTRRIAIVLSRFVTGSAQSFNQQTNVDLNNKYIVMDISDLKGKLLPVGMFIALDYCWDKIKEDRTKKKAIFIDETWMLIGESSNKYAAEFVLEVFKIIRGYGGAAIAATQDLSDFFALEDGKYGRGIINNSKTKIILNLEDDEAQSVKEILKLSRIEIRKILNFDRGEALITANNNKVNVLVKPSDVEKDLITTDRADLAEQAERAKGKEQRAKEKADKERREQAIIERQKALLAQEYNK